MKQDSHHTHIDYAALNDFADGDLAGRSREAVQAHLRSCAACREEVQFIRSSGATIRTLPTPKPPDELFTDLFSDESDPVTVLPIPGGRTERAGSSRGLWFRSVAAGALVLIAVVLLLTIGSGRAIAGSSTLTFARADEGALTLRYETGSLLAAEPSLRARIQYWVPDSLRYVQTEPGFRTIELSREEIGRFEGVVRLPHGTAYAVATVENNDGIYVDNDFGRLWEYLETDAQGRPTLQARRYQLLATPDFNVTRVGSLAERAASEFPEQPEFWFWLLTFRGNAVSASVLDTSLPTHTERLLVLDRAAREGDPGPVEMDALRGYARDLGRPDLAEHWEDELLARYPRHGLAAMATLRSIVTSSATNGEKLEALEEDWTLAGAPVTAQVGLRFSYEFADPILTEKWLARHAATSTFRSLDYDIDVAGAMMNVSALWPVAERWILDRLSDSRDWVGPARLLNESRPNFEAGVRQGRASLYLYLSRIRLGRNDRPGGTDAVERSVAEWWDPKIFVQAAEIHRAAGSDARATQLIALARVDPVIPLEPHFSAEHKRAWREPTETQLAEARVTLRERIVLELLDDHVDLDARLRSEEGEETTLRQIINPEGVTLLLSSWEPRDMPDAAFSLLERNAQRLNSMGVGTLFVVLQPDSSSEQRPGTDQHFYLDTTREVRQELDPWAKAQYFVIDRNGRLRHRGEDLESAIRIALVLST